MSHISFYPSDDDIFQISVSAFVYDKIHDVMFGSIDPAVIQQHGLKPVGWAAVSYNNDNAGLDIIAVGFPDPSRRLHAVVGKIKSFEDKVNVDDKDMPQTKCKIAADFPAFPGMSGGGVFSDGAFVGTVNTTAGLGSSPKSDFTPADFIYTAYEGLFPGRARNAGFQPVVQSPQTPQACQFDRRQFLGKILALN